MLNFDFPITESLYYQKYQAIINVPITKYKLHMIKSMCQPIMSIYHPLNANIESLKQIKYAKPIINHRISIICHSGQTSINVQITKTKSNIYDNDANANH